MHDIVKGSKVRARWWGEPRLVSLAGVQPKFEITEHVITGIVRHIRSNDPANPVQVWIFIDPESPWDGPKVRPPGCECETDHVVVDYHKALSINTALHEPR
jgi:hypothetical protein